MPCGEIESIGNINAFFKVHKFGRQLDLILAKHSKDTDDIPDPSVVHSDIICFKSNSFQNVPQRGTVFMKRTSSTVLRRADSTAVQR